MKKVELDFTTKVEVELPLYFTESYKDPDDNEHLIYNRIDENLVGLCVHRIHNRFIELKELLVDNTVVDSAKIKDLLRRQGRGEITQIAPTAFQFGTEDIFDEFVKLLV